MSKFFANKRARQKVFLSLYFSVIGFLCLSVVIAALFRYVDAFHCLYYSVESTVEKPRQTAFGFLIAQIPFICAYVYFRLGMRLGSSTKMNIAFISSLAIGVGFNFYIYILGWKNVFSVVTSAFMLFNLSAALALLTERDFCKYKPFLRRIGWGLVIVAVVCILLRLGGTLSVFRYGTAALGYCFIYLDVQSFWLKLKDVPDQESFDKLYCHALLNMILDFWLIASPMEMQLLTVKLLLSYYPKAKRRYFN